MDSIGVDSPRACHPVRRWLAGLTWAESIRLEAYGVSIGLRATHIGVLETLVSNLPLKKDSSLAGVRRMYSLIVGGATNPSSHQLYVNARLLVESHDRDYVLDVLESHLQIHLGKSAPEQIFVHAGVVGWRGRAILIPGRSHSGKSTLVAALLRAGADYHSDEFAVVDFNGKIHPYARPLSLRQPVGRPLRCSPASLGAATGDIPLRPALVLITRYRSGAHWRGRPITLGQALLELMKHTLPVRQRTEAAMNALQPALAETLVLKGTRGEAEDMVQDVLRLI